MPASLLSKFYAVGYHGVLGTSAAGAHAGMGRITLPALFLARDLKIPRDAMR